MASLEALEGLVLENILSRLDPKDVAALAWVSRRLRASAADDSIWRLFCSRDLDLSSPLHPDGNLCPSFKTAYGKWRESFPKYPWPLVVRTKRCWREIKDWLAANFVEALETLQQGASEEEIEDAEKKLGTKFPLPVRVLYRLVNGQNSWGTAVSSNGSFSPLGIIGGYSFYEYLENVHLLPLSMIVARTRRFRTRRGNSEGSKTIMVAASQRGAKAFFLDCGDGRLFVLSNDEEMLPCVPKAPILQDGMLLWLEEHSRRLRSGEIKTREFDNGKMICLFPEKSPLCSVAVTNGVKVRASAVFVPELSNLREEGNDKFWFAYSIRLSLASGGCMLDGTHHGSCQLYLRHWIIRAGENVVSDVRGEAVIGKYPLLLPGEEEFVYQSCASLPERRGSVEGAFTFVPGRLSRQEGRQFDVEVARFSLEAPSYIY